MSRFLFCICTLFTVSVQSQILDNTNCNIFSDDNFFNQQFIRQNKIKVIEAEISFKKDLKPIKSTKLFQRFEFDQGGKLIIMLESSMLNNTADTQAVHFIYDGLKLIKKRKTDTKGFYSYSYDYDADGNKIKEVYAREENKHSSRDQFELKQQFIIYQELYEFRKVSEGVFKRIIYNSQDKPYQHIFYTYDKYGNLIKEVSTLVVTKKTRTINYRYDEYHRPIEKTDVTNITGRNELRHEYEYDEIGNILEERFYNNNVHKTTRQFLYDARMVLSARLTKDEETGTIEIVKYNYTFR